MWKVIKTSNTTAVKVNGKVKQAPIKQIYYINEDGEAKYENSLGESKILTIGDGLWVAKSGDITDDNCINEIKIIGIGDHIYNLVYTNFIGSKTRRYQIHHIDYNRNNNSVDNIICISDKEHRAIHRPLANAMACGDISTSLYQEYSNYIDAHNSYKELEIHIGRYDEYKTKWNNYLLEQINKYNTDRHIQYTTRLAEQKQRRQNQILLEKEERQRKIDSGEYYLDNNGKLIKKNRPKWTDERRAKTMTTRETSTAWKDMPNKVSKTLTDKWKYDEDFRSYMIDCYNKNK